MSTTSRPWPKCLNFLGDDQKLAEFLIQSGARINDANNVGETPLHYAARSGMSFQNDLHFTIISKNYCRYMIV